MDQNCLFPYTNNTADDSGENWTQPIFRTATKETHELANTTNTNTKFLKCVFFFPQRLDVLAATCLTNNSRRRPVGLFLKGGKTAQLRSKTASSSTTLKVEVFLEGEKTAQLRSKTASSSTTLKVEVFLEGEKTAQLRSKTASSSTTLFLWSQRGHYAVTTVTTRSLRSLRGHYAVTTRSLRSLRGHYGHYAVTTRSLRGHYGHYGHYAVTTRSLRGHYAVTTRSLRSLRGHYGHYAVTTVTTRSLRSLRGHYAVTTRSLRSRGHYAVKKSYTFEAKKAAFSGKNGSTSLQNAVSAGCVQTDITLASDFFLLAKPSMSTKRDMGERGCWTKEQNKSESSLFDPERIEDSDFINASNLIHYSANRFQV